MADSPIIHWVSTSSSPEFSLLLQTLARTSIVALDAEWKPHHHTHNRTEPTFPAVCLLQLACRVRPDPMSSDPDEVVVFLVDLQEMDLGLIYGELNGMLVDPGVLKLGFRFKQDLVYLSSTFSTRGCDPGFDRVEPFLDITSIYHLLKQKQPGRRSLEQTKSLATICEELLGLSLSKELQCSDWSQRPLTEEQKTYAAADAHCLLEIFSIFEAKIDKEASFLDKERELDSPSLSLGLKEILKESTVCQGIVSNRVCDASNVVRAAISSEFFKDLPSSGTIVSDSLCRSVPLDATLLKIMRKYGTKILLKESDRKPRVSRKKGKRKPTAILNIKPKGAEMLGDWQGLPLWDESIGGDGCPKFLCDVMVEGLAKHLRCVGIDAAVPNSKKPESRELIEQARREKRVLLTRDAKLIRYEYLIKNQIYRVKSLLKNEQLLEVIQTFQLNISEDQLMSRCTKCNGRFIQRPLTTEEAVEAAKGFQKIPNCLFNKNLEFWQCMDCYQLYWEGTQYHNAVEKFINVCNLNK